MPRYPSGNNDEPEGPLTNWPATSRMAQSSSPLRERMRWHFRKNDGTLSLWDVWPWWFRVLVLLGIGIWFSPAVLTMIYIVKKCGWTC